MDDDWTSYSWCSWGHPTFYDESREENVYCEICLRRFKRLVFVHIAERFYPIGIPKTSREHFIIEDNSIYEFKDYKRRVKVYDNGDDWGEWGGPIRV